MRRVAVLTGSSVSGAACIAALRTKSSVELVGLYRTEEKANAAEAAYDFGTATASLECVAGVDATVPGSLWAGLEGADTAVLVTPLDMTRGMGTDAECSINMIKAAIQVGVRRIVHVGSWTTRPEAAPSLPGLSSRFLPTEQYLQQEVGDKAEWTVLRGGYFMNNLKMLFAASVAAGNGVSFPDVRAPVVDTRDIGDCAAALCLADDARYHGKFIECCGPEMLDFATIAKTLGDVTGQHVPYTAMSAENWCPGKPPPLQELLRYMEAAQASAIPFEPDVVAELLGRPPTDFRTWATEYASIFKPAEPE